MRKAAKTAIMFKKSRQMNDDKTKKKKESNKVDARSDQINIDEDIQICDDIIKNDSIDIRKMKEECELEKIKLERRKIDLEFSRIESSERMKKEEFQFKKEMISKMMEIIKE